jgi:hypothetical protein
MLFRAAPVALGLLLLAACAVPEARVVSSANGRLSAEEAAAFTSICEPIVDPLPRPAWSRDQLVIKLDEGMHLSDQDIEEILAIAHEAGMTEPVLLSAGNRIQIGWHFQVQLLGHPHEDSQTRTRAYRVLSLCCPEWRNVNYSLFHPAGNGGGWELDFDDSYSSSPWSDGKTWYARHASKVWEFSASESVTYDLALEILLAFAYGNFVDQVSVETPEFLRGPIHQTNGMLGFVVEKYDHVEHTSPEPDPLNFPWHFRMRFPGRGYSGLNRDLALRDDGWILVGASGWNG